MDFTTVPAPPATREMRGLALHRDHGHEIERVYPSTYLVPSCSGDALYTVHLAPRERCECPDFEVRGEACKHVYAATIKAARVRVRTGSGA